MPDPQPKGCECLSCGKIQDNMICADCGILTLDKSLAKKPDDILAELTFKEADGPLVYSSKTKLPFLKAGDLVGKTADFKFHVENNLGKTGPKVIGIDPATSVGDHAALMSGMVTGEGTIVFDLETSPGGYHDFMEQWSHKALQNLTPEQKAALQKVSEKLIDKYFGDHFYGASNPCAEVDLGPPLKDLAALSQKNPPTATYTSHKSQGSSWKDLYQQMPMPNHHPTFHSWNGVLPPANLKVGDVVEHAGKLHLVTSVVQDSIGLETVPHPMPRILIWLDPAKNCTVLRLSWTDPQTGSTRCRQKEMDSYGFKTQGPDYYRKTVRALLKSAGEVIAPFEEILAHQMIRLLEEPFDPPFSDMPPEKKWDWPQPVTATIGGFGTVTGRMSSGKPEPKIGDFADAMPDVNREVPDDDIFAQYRAAAERGTVQHGGLIAHPENGPPVMLMAPTGAPAKSLAEVSKAFGNMGVSAQQAAAAIGSMGALVGKHPSVVLIDDVDGHLDNLIKEKLEKKKSFWHQIMTGQVDLKSSDFLGLKKPSIGDFMFGPDPIFYSDYQLVDGSAQKGGWYGMDPPEHAPKAPDLSKLRPKAHRVCREHGRLPRARTKVNVRARHRR